MVLLNFLWNPVQNFVKRSIHKYNPIMNCAYLRHQTDESKFKLTFQYVEASAKVNRQFNFCRQLSEPISTFTSRVATNIAKIFAKKNKKEPCPPTVEVLVKVDGVIAPEDALCGDVFTSNSTSKIVTLHIRDQEFQVLINSPWVNSLVLPTSILANFPVYPLKFEASYTNADLSEFVWSKCNNEHKNNWTELTKGFVYTPTNEDIGSYLKVSCLPKNKDLVGPAAESVSVNGVQAGPGICPFETRHKFTEKRCDGKEFRVVSYNILADLYCDSDYTRTTLHPYCPAYALTIDYRKQLFIKEITGYNSDIICLQEVDKKIYEHDLYSFFARLGYESSFCKKRDEVAEGVACFFDKSRFSLIESHRLVISDEFDKNPLFAELWDKIKTNPKLSERILNRSSVLQVSVLQSLDNEEILVVGNTHLYFHPDSDHIRLLQAAAIIKYLENIFSKIQDANNGKRTSLILCGDFNTVPECGIYQLYTSGYVEENHPDFQSNKEESVQLPLKQSFHLQSACGSPKYTNFTELFADCLDYIFCEKESFEVVQVVPFPTIEELSQHTALPSVVFPSDHIALIADLRWKSE